MAIIGSDQVLRRGSAALHFGKIKVNIGKPLDFSDLYDGANERAAIEEVGRRTMAAIAELRDQIP
jgi:1-acyl-sn-glycerol-3-phosphate acyltransferase